jgi:integrase
MARPKLEQPNYRLTKRGRYFYVRWWANGTWQRVSTGTEDRQTAQRFLAQFVAGRGTPAPPEQPTINQILDGYLADKKGRAASYATLEACATALRRHLGDLEPGHLTRERSRFYAARRRAEGYMVGPPDKRRKKPVSNGTIIREIVTLRAAFVWAKGEKWIPEVPYVEAPSAPPARDRWLTRAEAARLLEQAIAPHVRLFIALALHTAARTGALLELTWDQVDLEAGVINLGHGTGNKRRGPVPINRALRPYLEEAYEASTSEWVVEHGGNPVASIKTGFRAAAARAKVVGATPHVMRHTSVTWMVQDGVPTRMVARYASMSEAMVETRYGHHSPEWLRQAADALSGPVAPKTRERNAKEGIPRKPNA